MKIQRFEELEIWRLSMEITKGIYLVSNTGEFARDFGLKDQIRRAIISVSSNIAEGFEKNNNNEFIRFLKIAKGSLGEVRSQLYVSLSLSYIPKEEFENLNQRLEILGKQIGSFIYYLETQRKNGEFVTR